MHRFLLVVMMSALVSACGFDKAPPATNQVDDLKPVPGAQQMGGEEPAEVEVDHLARLAEDLVRDGPGAFRFDRSRETKDGGTERQVFVEMLGANDEDAADLAASILESGGFELVNRFGDENGVRLTYRYGDSAPVRVLVRSREAHSKLLHDEATSSVYVTQPIDAP